jgi:hypothetical protein
VAASDGMPSLKKAIEKKLVQNYGAMQKSGQ